METYLIDWLNAETQEDRDKIDLEEFKKKMSLHEANNNPVVRDKYLKLIKEIIK